jgi:hypothetical protein
VKQHKKEGQVYPWPSRKPVVIFLEQTRVINSGLELVQFGMQFGQCLRLRCARASCQILRLERIVFQIVQFFFTTAGHSNQFVLRIPNRFGINDHILSIGVVVRSTLENLGVREAASKCFSGLASMPKSSAITSSTFGEVVEAELETEVRVTANNNVVARTLKRIILNS